MGDRDLYQDRIYEVQFHQITYLLHLIITPNSLSIDLEDKVTGEIWIGDFTPQKLQQNSQKTGNFKKYSTFVQMLIAAINNTSQAVELDLLTYHDLEQLKTKKTQSKTIASNNTKRYLMLNYIAEYDRIHYPLQLVYQQVPSADRSKLTIKRLRSELDIYRKGNGSLEEVVNENIYLKQENELFKARIKKLEENQNRSTIVQKTPIQKIVIKEVKNDQLQKQYLELKKVLSDYERQIVTYKSKLQQKDNQIYEMKEQITKVNQINCGEQEKQIKIAEQKLCKQFNQQLATLGKETQQLIAQLRKTKQQSKRLKNKNLQLQKQLSSIVKRNLSQSKISAINTKRSETPRSKSKQKIQSTFKSSKSKQKPRQSSIKRVSVMDSDTQSSRMRRMSNRNTSPFRNTQTLKRTPSNNSIKGTTPKSNRSRSRSQSKKADSSVNNSQLLTESQANYPTMNFASDSDDEYNRISEIIEMKKKNRLDKMSTNKGNVDKTMVRGACQSGVQKKFQHIADLLKKSRKQLSD